MKMISYLCNTKIKTTDTMKESFDVLRLSREDFEAKGFDASNVDDETMEHVARKIGDTIMDGGDFWMSVEYWGDSLNLPRIMTHDAKKVWEIACANADDKGFAVIRASWNFHGREVMLVIDTQSKDNDVAWGRLEGEYGRNVIDNEELFDVLTVNEISEFNEDGDYRAVGNPIAFNGVFPK